MRKNKEFDGIDQDFPVYDFPELELPVIEFPKFEMLHFELLDVENLLEYELEYQVTD